MCETTTYARKCGYESGSRILNSAPQVNPSLVYPSQLRRHQSLGHSRTGLPSRSTPWQAASVRFHALLLRLDRSGTCFAQYPGKTPDGPDTAHVPGNRTPLKATAGTTGERLKRDMAVSPIRPVTKCHGLPKAICTRFPREH
jgi:hypothetical protein